MMIVMLLNVINSKHGKREELFIVSLTTILVLLVTSVNTFTQLLLAGNSVPTLLPWGK